VEEDTAEEEERGVGAVLGTTVRTQAVLFPRSSTPEHFPFGQRGPSSTRLVARTSYRCRQNTHSPLCEWEPGDGGRRRKNAVSVAGTSGHKYVRIIKTVKAIIGHKFMRQNNVALNAGTGKRWMKVVGGKELDTYGGKITPSWRLQRDSERIAVIAELGVVAEIADMDLSETQNTQAEGPLRAVLLKHAGGFKGTGCYSNAPEFEIKLKKGVEPLIVDKPTRNDLLPSSA
jgi:hypothetical protein